VQSSKTSLAAAISVISEKTWDPVACANASREPTKGSHPITSAALTTPERIAPSTKAVPIFPHPMIPSFMAGD
jgi:hypothetical protein